MKLNSLEYSHSSSNCNNINKGKKAWSDHINKIFFDQFILALKWELCWNNLYLISETCPAHFYKHHPPMASLILQYINLSNSLSSSKWLESPPGLLSLFSVDSCSMKAFVCLRKGFPDTGVGLILLEGALVDSVDPSCWPALTVVKLILRDFVIGLDFSARGVLSKFGEFLKIILVRLPLSPARSCILWKKK